MHSRSSASLVEAFSRSVAMAVLTASAARIITSDPARPGGRCSPVGVRQFAEDKRAQASPQSWLVFESGMARPMPRYLVANC